MAYKKTDMKKHRKICKNNFRVNPFLKEVTECGGKRLSVTDKLRTDEATKLADETNPTAFHYLRRTLRKGYSRTDMHIDKLVKVTYN